MPRSRAPPLLSERMKLVVKAAKQTNASVANRMPRQPNPSNRSKSIRYDEVEDEDVADISWIMHLIASDKLYTIDIRSAGGANLSSEMTAWLEDNLGMKKDIEAEAEEGDENATNLATAGNLKRQETKIVQGDSAASRELARLDDVHGECAVLFLE